MIFLITGPLGAGKTSNILWDLIKNPIYDGRPKFANFIKGFDYEKNGFEQIDKNDLENWCYWSDPNDDFSVVSNFPKGSILLFDEADLFFPSSISDKNPPRWLREMARSRHHGLDFYIITQQSKMVSSFLHGLIQTHIHYHRPNGSEEVTRYTWEFHQPNVYARSNRLMGLPQKVKVNEEVFTLYESTVQNTRKKTPPVHIYKKLALLALPMLLAPFFVWYFMYYRHLPPETVAIQETTKDSIQETTKQAESKIPQTTNTTQTASTGAPVPSSSSGSAVLTAQDFVPSDPLRPYTAPAYQDLARPTDFPRIAMCITSNATKDTNVSYRFRDGACKCFTQQYTPVDVPQNACLRMVKEGWFDDFATGRAQQDIVLSGKPDESNARHAQQVQQSKM